MPKAVKTGQTRWLAAMPVCLCLLPVQAEPPNLPPGASPGAALPADVLVDLPLFSDEPLLPVIPPTVQRPLGDEEGERIFVTRFDVVGVEERPEQGVSQQAVEQLLESLRVEKQNLSGIGEHGFTSEERKSIASFLQSVVESPDLDVKLDEYKALVGQLRLERIQREAGLTIGQLQRIADEVTRFYREKGFILAQAYLPTQDVEKGVVQIEVVEGKLGKVLVEGNQRFSPTMLARPFEDLIDAPVMGEPMEQALSLMSDYPGISAFGVLQPGAALGTTDLVIKVQKEELFNVTAGIDNKGSRLTGRYRATLDLDWNSPLLSADILRGRFSRSFNERLAINADVDYRIPLFSPVSGIGFTASRGVFDVGRELKDQDISGINTTTGLYLHHTFQRGREQNLRGRLLLNRKRAVTSLGNVDTFRDDLAILSLEGSFDSINTESQSIQSGTLRYDHGFKGPLGSMDRSTASAANGGLPSSRRTGNGENVSGGFDKLVFGYARVQRISDTSSLLLRMSGQLSKDPLVSVEQFAIGGPDSIRAFPVTEYLVDRGLFASVDYSFSLPGSSNMIAYGGRSWSEILKLSFFADFATGWLVDPRDDERDAGLDHMRVLGAGVGMELLLPGNLVARLQAAEPLGADRAAAEEEESTQIWFDLKYNF